MGPGGRSRPALIALALTLGACGAPDPEPEQPPPPNGPIDVVLIVADGLRADHVRAYGYRRPTTPALDRLAAESVLFEHALAPVNRTEPSLASLLTGVRPGRHGFGMGVDTPPSGSTLAGGLETLAERLAGRGFSTGGFVNPGPLRPHRGLERGHDRWVVADHDDAAVAAFGDWLAAHDDRPLFAYLQLVEAHYPFTPLDAHDRFSQLVERRRIRDLMHTDPVGLARVAETDSFRPEDRDEVVALYDAELLALDGQVRQALDALRRQGRYRESLVIVTAAQGMALWDRGRFGVGGDRLEQGLVRVPLIVKLPHGRHAGERVSRVVRLEDLVPTVLAAIAPVPDATAETEPDEAMPLDDGLDGHPWLVPTAEGLTLRVPDAPAATVTVDPAGPRAVYLDGLAYRFGPGPEQVAVFDLRTDPGELRDLADQLAPTVLAAARLTLERLLAGTPPVR